MGWGEAVGLAGFKQEAFLRHFVETVNDFGGIGRAEFSGEFVSIEAFLKEAEVQHGFFGGFIGGGQFFDILDLAGGILQIGIEVIFVFKAFAVEVGSGSRPESEIFAAAPVIEVVPAFKAGAGEVGDFVVDKTFFEQERACFFEEFRLGIVGGEV